MNSRMDKYEDDTPALKKRTEKNANLYQTNGVDEYDKFDINSNISVLKKDARNIDVNQIRDMLDKKYRDNIPQRKSISIDTNDLSPIRELKEDTKEYDINSILKKAKIEKTVDYDLDRLNKVDNSGLSIIDEINKKYEKQINNETEEEQELKNLINTITELELKSNNKEADLLDLQGDDLTEKLPATEPEEKENTFYTGKLKVNKEDYNDFEDIEKDIKSNSIVIKILIFILIIVALAVAAFLVNKYFKLGLF